MPVEVTRGDGPIVLGLPHTGTHVPGSIRADLNDRGRGLDDTDWHIERLYEGLVPGATTVRATHHRYVIDVNRDPSGASLYPGQNTTGLVPLTDFDGAGIWTRAPDDAEIEERRLSCHAPYHAALAAEQAACAPSMAPRSSMIATRSAPGSPFSSRGCCRTSASAQIWAPPAIPASSAPCTGSAPVPQAIPAC